MNIPMPKGGGFPSRGGGGNNMQQMLKQAQQMQRKMADMQEELEAREYQASAGGGMVSAVVSGKHEILRLTIEKDAVDPDDVELLQDTVIAAVNQALREADDTMQNEMSKLTGGLNVPGLF